MTGENLNQDAVGGERTGAPISFVWFRWVEFHLDPAVCQGIPEKGDGCARSSNWVVVAEVGRLIDSKAIS